MNCVMNAINCMSIYEGWVVGVANVSSNAGIPLVILALLATFVYYYTFQRLNQALNNCIPLKRDINN